MLDFASLLTVGALAKEQGVKECTVGALTPTWTAATKEQAKAPCAPGRIHRPGGERVRLPTWEGIVVCEQMLLEEETNQQIPGHAPFPANTLRSRSSRSSLWPLLPFEEEAGIVLCSVASSLFHDYLTEARTLSSL